MGGGHGNQLLPKAWSCNCSARKGGSSQRWVKLPVPGTHPSSRERSLEADCGSHPTPLRPMMQQCALGFGKGLPLYLPHPAHSSMCAQPTCRVAVASEYVNGFGAH